MARCVSPWFVNSLNPSDILIIDSANTSGVSGFSSFLMTRTFCAFSDVFMLGVVGGFLRDC